MTRVVIGERRYVVEVADTFWKRVKGLSGRERLECDGMLFLFPFRWHWGFWMRGVKVPLYIIWIDRGRVVGVERRPIPASPPEALVVSHPPCRVAQAIELVADPSLTLPSVGDRCDVLLG